MPLLLLALLACTTDDPAPSDDTDVASCDFPPLTTNAPAARVATAARPEVAALAGTVNELTVDLLRELSVADGDLALSGLSAVGMFSLLLPGADAATADALAGVLGVDQELAQHHTALSELLIELEDPDRGWGFGWGTSFWHRPSLTPVAGWVEQAQALYRLDVAPTDFQGAPDAARAAINAWVEAHTRCLIPEFYPQGYDFSRTVHIAVHAMGLEAKWERPFDAAFTADRQFRLADGTTTYVPTMTREDFAGAATTEDGLTRVRLPYLGRDLAMYLVIPDDPSDPAALLGGADGATFDAWADLPREGTLPLRLPKWTTLSTHLLLPGPLESMGYTPLINAPLPGVCEGCALPDLVRQVVVVLVDEEGTRAAAATSGETNDSEPTWVEVDRPFLWFLRDDPSGVVLWAGLVRDPT